MIGSGGRQATAPAIDFSRPVYVKKDRVVCPETATLGAYIDGQQGGGEAEGHQRVLDLFFHPRHGCVRMFGRTLVKLRTASVAPTRLVDIEWPGPLTHRYLVLPDDLEN
jgi:hypothetical protein